MVSFADGGTDSSGAALQPVAQVSGHTMKAPAVLSFRPQDGSVTLDTGQLISVRFSAPMDEKATESAFSVTADGRAVAGNLYWSEGDTVLALAPRYAFKVGAKVVARITTTARSATGMHLEKVEQRHVHRLQAQGADGHRPRRRLQQLRRRWRRDRCLRIRRPPSGVTLRCTTWA